MSEFADYCCCSNWDGNGEILNRENEVVWRFQTTGLKRRPSECGRLLVFSFRDASGNELATINLDKRLPLAQFSVVEEGLRVCKIWQRSILFTKYEFVFENKSK